MYTLHIGEFTANNTFRSCNKCKENRIFGGEDIKKLVPANSNYGYDVLIYIGESMFIQHLQAIEIQILLKRDYNIPISISEIEYSAKKFIVYLAEIQELYNFKIVDCMKNNGGYILHLDALGGTGGDRLITGLDSISDIVLNNSKIASEKSVVIRPFLEKIKKNFGDPLAVVQDMGRGIMKAVEDVFEGVRIFICHFHFLRDLGKDLLKENHDILKKRIRHFNIRVELRNIAKKLNIIYDKNKKNDDKYSVFFVNLYTIIEWVLDWKSTSNGYGFPFDRQYYDLVTRIKNARESLSELNVLTGTLREDEIEINDVYEKTTKLLLSISSDPETNDTIDVLNVDIKIFDDLRQTMRIAPKEKGKGLNDEGDENIKLIETEVIQFIKTTKKNKKFS